jgi:hypothetical protein
MKWKYLTELTAENNNRLNNLGETDAQLIPLFCGKPSECKYHWYDPHLAEMVEELGETVSHETIYTTSRE